MKKIIIYCILTAIFPMFLYAQNLREAVFNGDIDYIQKYVQRYGWYTNEYIYFSNSDLRILRNTIYATHGYIFRARDLQEHFQKFAWYNGTKQNVENELSENEQRLIRIIFIEYNGKLYKACNLFNNMLY
jgi:hypothetical protein